MMMVSDGGLAVAGREFYTYTYKRDRFQEEKITVWVIHFYQQDTKVVGLDKLPFPSLNLVATG